MLLLLLHALQMLRHLTLLLPQHLLVLLELLGSHALQIAGAHVRLPRECWGIAGPQA